MSVTSLKNRGSILLSCFLPLLLANYDCNFAPRLTPTPISIMMRVKSRTIMTRQSSVWSISSHIPSWFEHNLQLLKPLRAAKRWTTCGSTHFMTKDISSHAISYIDWCRFSCCVVEHDCEWLKIATLVLLHSLGCTWLTVHVSSFIFMSGSHNKQTY